MLWEGLLSAIDGGDCGWPTPSAVQRSGEALALGGDCGRLPGAAEWRFGEASTLGGRRYNPQGGVFAYYVAPPACPLPPLCTESSTCAPSPRRRLPARSSSCTESSCTESSTCALSLRRRLPARSTPSPTSSIHTICPSAWRHDRSLRHFSIFTPAKSGLDVFGHGSPVPAPRAVNDIAPCSTQLQGTQRALGGIALGDGGDCGWPTCAAPPTT